MIPRGLKRHGDRKLILSLCAREKRWQKGIEKGTHRLQKHLPRPRRVYICTRVPENISARAPTSQSVSRKAICPIIFVYGDRIFIHIHARIRERASPANTRCELYPQFRVGWFARRSFVVFVACENSGRAPRVEGCRKGGKGDTSYEQSI